MNTDDILQDLAALLRQVDEDAGRRTDAQLRGKHLGDDLGLDSLDILKFILLVEERFGCKLPDADIDRLGLLKLDNLAAYLADRGARCAK